MLTINDIRNMADSRTLARGKQYYMTRKVIYTLMETPDLLVASVSGSGNAMYDVAVKVSERPLDAYCTCPVGFNCKHAVAALLSHLEQTQSQSGSIAPVRARPDSARKSSSLAKKSTPVAKKPSFQQWLAEFDNQSAPAMSSLQTGRNYLLYQMDTERGDRIAIRLCQGYLRKDMIWSRVQPATHDFSELRYRSPSYLLPEDKPILGILSSQADYNGYTLTREEGALALKRILDSRRLIASGGGTTISLADAKPLLFDWSLQGTQHHLSLGLEGVEQWRLLPLSPPYYFDRVRHGIGVIETTLSGSRLQQLTCLPPVSEQDMTTLALKLHQQRDVGAIELPVEVQIQILDQPIPHLTLVTANTPQGQTVPALLLQWDYGDVAIALSFDDDTVEPLTVQRDDRFYQIERNREQENQHLDTLSALGLKVNNELEPWNEAWIIAAGNLSQLAAKWRTLTTEALPGLEQQGWRISQDESYRFNLKPAQVSMRLADAEKGWFDFSLDISVDNVIFSTMDLVAFWLENGNPEQFLFPLDNGDWVEVDTAPLKAIQTMIVELFNQKRLDKPVRMPEFNVALLGQADDIDTRKAPRSRALMKRLRNFSGLTQVKQPTTLKATLRDYQQQGLNWLAFLQEYQFGGILADDMGLGKTLQTLALLLHMKTKRRLKKPALVVGPTSLVSNWKHEAEKFAPSLKTLVIHGPMRADQFRFIKDADLVITTYPLLWRDAQRYVRRQFSLLILDEAQYIKNANTKIADQVRRIKADTRLCLTGTPLENHLGELWAIMDFALPGLLGGQSHFRKWFRQPIEEQGDEQRNQELASRVAPFMLRRTKQDVVLELPEKNEIIQYVELEGKQKQLYESIRISMEKRVRDLMKQKGLARSHIEFLDALLKLRQACIDPRLVKMDGAADIKQRAKLEWLQENLPQLVEEGRNILVFSQFTQALGLIEDCVKTLSIPYVKLTGQTRNRQKAIATFQSGAARIFLISLKAGGSGLNLTQADVVIHVDPWWNPAVENQATDRAYRIGQDKPVFVYKLVAADTVEERIQGMQKQKAALANALFEGAGKAKLPARGDELLALFS